MKSSRIMKIFEQYVRKYDMNNIDIMSISGLSQSSVTTMGMNENVNTEGLVRICLALNCDIGDIAEIILPESQQA